MHFTDVWLDEHIDRLYKLNDEGKFLKAVGVRGHRYILKQKAKKYMMDKVEAMLKNKYIRRRVK